MKIGILQARVDTAEAKAKDASDALAAARTAEDAAMNAWIAVRAVWVKGDELCEAKWHAAYGQLQEAQHARYIAVKAAAYARARVRLTRKALIKKQGEEL